jgi:transcriptional regulator with XRE-family HTH domain
VNTVSDVWQKLSTKRYRSAFARTQFKRLVPLQIQSLRRHRGWSQEVLAANAKLTQGVISRAEDQDYGNLTVNTILSIAEGFDVAFVGRFVPFSELDKWYVNLSHATMNVPSFDDENVAMIESENAENAVFTAQKQSPPASEYGFAKVAPGRKVQPDRGISCGLLSAAEVSRNTQSGGGMDHAAVGGRPS